MFTTLAKVIAVIGLLFGVSMVLGGFSMADLPPEELAYYTRVDRSAGDYVDGGIMMVLASTVIGVLAEISRKLDKD